MPRKTVPRFEVLEDARHLLQDTVRLVQEGLRGRVLRRLLVLARPARATARGRRRARAAARLQRLQSRNPRRQLAGSREASGARDARLLALAVHELKERAVAVGRAERGVRFRQLLLQERRALVDQLLHVDDLVGRRRVLARCGQAVRERAARVRHIRRQERLAQPERRQQRQPPERRRVVAGLGRARDHFTHALRAWGAARRSVTGKRG